MSFSTDSDLSYIYLQYKSEKFHGLFGLGWKNQEHTVCMYHITHHEIFLFLFIAILIVFINFTVVENFSARMGIIISYFFFYN